MKDQSMSPLVRPQTLYGFRDIMPAEMLIRNEAVSRIQRVYEAFGYVPLDTPVLELLGTLVDTGGDEANSQIFALSTPEDQNVGMRFDLTVPFARFIAQYVPHDIKLPFRRYHIGPVFRADDPQPLQGRFRQFTQFDVDVAGTDDVAADAEIAAVMCAALRSLGLRPAARASRGYFVRVNNRKLVDAFLYGLGITTNEQARHVLRVIDKRDKLSDADFVKEMGSGRVDASGDRIPGVGLDGESITAILEWASVSGATRREVFDNLCGRIANSVVSKDAISEVGELLGHMDALGLEEDEAIIDPSLARGLAYYTGTVFEGTLAGAGVGSVMGGGRYDGLVSRFRDEPVPAVGASIGLDRLVTGLRNLDETLGVSRNAARVLVLQMPNSPADEASRVAAELRAADIGAELYLGAYVGKVARQLSYANERGFDVAVMVGSKELANGTVTLKDLKRGLTARENLENREQFRASASIGQVFVRRDELVAAVQNLLKGDG